MHSFTNHDNLVVPNEEFTLKHMEKYAELDEANKKIDKSLFEYRKEIAKHEESIKQHNKSIADLKQHEYSLHREQQKNATEQESVAEKIIIYNVEIAYSTEEDRLFSKWADASNFKNNLIEEGIKADDIEIQLVNSWNDFSDIDSHKNPDLHGFFYDPESLYKRYRCLSNQAKKRSHEEDQDGENKKTQ